MSPVVPNQFPSKETIGGLAVTFGVGAGLFLLLGPTGQYETSRPGGTRETGSTSGIDYILGEEHADPALFFWSLFVFGITLIGGYGVGAGNRYVVWAVGRGLLALSVLGIFSIGLYIAPAALLFVVTAVLLTRAQRTDEP